MTDNSIPITRQANEHQCIAVRLMAVYGGSSYQAATSGELSWFTPRFDLFDQRATVNRSLLTSRVDIVVDCLSIGRVVIVVNFRFFVTARIVPCIGLVLAARFILHAMIGFDQIIDFVTDIHFLDSQSSKCRHSIHEFSDRIRVGQGLDERFDVDKRDRSMIVVMIVPTMFMATTNSRIKGLIAIAVVVMDIRLLERDIQLLESLLQRDTRLLENLLEARLLQSQLENSKISTMLNVMRIQNNFRLPFSKLTSCRGSLVHFRLLDSFNVFESSIGVPFSQVFLLRFRGSASLSLRRLLAQRRRRQRNRSTNGSARRGCDGRLRLTVVMLR